MIEKVINFIKLHLNMAISLDIRGIALLWMHFQNRTLINSLGH